MNETSTRERRGGVGRDAVAIGACLAIAVALVHFIARANRGGAPEPAAVAVATPATAPEAASSDAAKSAAPPATPAGVPPAVPVAAPGGATGGATVETAAAPSGGDQSPEVPSVDVMRVESGGAAVVAGRAAPGARVSVLAGDRPLAEVRADEAGRFVALFDAGVSAEPRALTVEARGADGAPKRSEQVLVLLPDAAAAPAEAAPSASPAPTQAAPSAPDVVAVAPGPAVGTTAILTPEAAEVMPLARPEGMPDGQVAFGSISYGEHGAVALSGFGAPGAAVRVYVNDAPGPEARVGADGRWRAQVPEGAPGTYTLRVDQLDETGKVVSRTETPFRRDTGGAAPARPGEVAVVVQPGNSLWTLARIHYGTGVRYTRIFDANAAVISDPDLIYPGQIFRVPEAAE